MLNVEHAEYYCGLASCPGLLGVFWRAKFISFSAALARPNATFTNWTTTFPTYDHPHKYRIAAWATDLDGQVDTSKAPGAADLRTRSGRSDALRVAPKASASA